MRGHIYRRSKGSFTLKYELGPDPVTGRRRQKTSTVRGTRRDAEKELARILHDLDRGTFVEPTSMTVSEFTKTWLETYVKPNLRARTFARFEGIVRLYINPVLGNVKLRDLNPRHINEAIAAWRRNGRADGRGELSPQTVFNQYRCLRRCLNHAVQWGYLSRNPVASCDAPRVPRKEVRALTEDQARELLEVAGDTEMGRLILVALHTGLRRGELLALRFEDVDWERDSLKVSRSVVRLPGEGFVFTAPKSKSSNRRVVLTKSALAALSRQRAIRAERRLALGTEFEDNGLVFAAQNGSPRDQTVFYRQFKRLAAAAGVPHATPHMLRHTCATMHLRNGRHPAVVAQILGHSDVGTTMNIYSHVAMDLQEEAAELLEARLRWSS